MSRVQFLPHLRLGLASGLREPYSVKLPADPTLQLDLSLEGDSQTIPRTLRLRGPGHVLGLPAGVVQKTVPADGEKSAPTGHMVQVELRVPGLPWVATPAAPDSKGLPPWLRLVVVRAAVARISSASPCPILHLDPGHSAELPPVDQARAWAHAQVILEDNEDPATVLKNRPTAALARLLCPRRLEPATRYIAALVPTFKAGLQAGLGQPVTEKLLAWSWEPGQVEAAGIDLPVYHSWSFETVAEGSGDFEDLAAKILPMSAPAGLGQRPVQVIDGGSRVFPEKQRPSGTFVYRGALGPKVDRPAPTEDSPTAAALLATWKSTAADPVLTPPVIGSFQGAPDSDPVLSLTDASRSWIRSLNLDPSLRAVAGLGAAIVQENQEALVASARAQAAQLREANQQIRQNLLAVEVGRFLNRRIQRLEEAELIQITRPAHKNLLANSTATAAAGMAAGSSVASLIRCSDLPGSTISGELRRALRPAGPVGRRIRSRSLPTSGLVRNLFSSTAAQKEGPVSAANPGVAKVGSSLKESLQARDVALRLRLESRVPTTAAPSSRPGRPLLARPVFREPLASHLGRLSPEFLLPGVSELPDDKVLLLEADTGFVAALLAGANDALARELLWREYPFDRSWTFFRHFWDRTSPGKEGELAKGIRQWQSWPPLAANSADTRVLLIKAALLHRFPGTLIYGWVKGSSSPRRAPLYSGELAPGIQYVAFEKGTEAWSKWLFVVEQPVESPRFGLDQRPGAASSSPTLDSLCWEDLNVPPGGFLPATHDLFAGLGVGTDAASLARITFQKPIRVVLPASAWGI